MNTLRSSFLSVKILRMICSRRVIVSPSSSFRKSGLRWRWNRIPKQSLTAAIMMKPVTLRSKVSLKKLSKSQIRSQPRSKCLRSILITLRPRSPRLSPRSRHSAWSKCNPHDSGDSTTLIMPGRLSRHSSPSSLTSTFTSETWRTR